MALNVKRTSEIAGPGARATVLCYGRNGSGKTRFAATFPHPYFLVPQSAANEMKTVAAYDLPVITFGSVQELGSQAKELVTMVQSGKVTDCKTIVVDNLTAIQQDAEQELKQRLGRRQLRIQDWGEFGDFFVGLLHALHQSPTHVVWITHSEVTTITSESQPDTVVHGYTLIGNRSKRLFPNRADFILYHEAVDRGVHYAKTHDGQQTEYLVNLKPKGPWDARIRVEANRNRDIPQTIPNHYDELATIVGWPSQQEAEEAA